MSVDPAARFPGESGEYRLARNRLLAAQIELRRTIERVAAQRRTLPPGGAVLHDYLFEETSGGGGQVRFSELFAPGKDTQVIYSFMFPRWSGDTRPGPRRARRPGCRLPRRRARRVPRSWTRSTVLLRTSPARSTSLWSPGQIRLGSVTSHRNAAGGICAWT